MGKEKVPPQGARFDLAFEGNATGRLSGQVRGVDYLRMRADGRIALDIRAIIKTADAFRIGLSADGVAVLRPGEPIADLRENVTLTWPPARFTLTNTCSDILYCLKAVASQSNNPIAYLFALGSGIHA